jgi:very-short-patch-repair endonuclease
MAFQHRMVDLAGIRAVLRRNPRARRRRLTWLTAADAAGGSEALAELDILRLLRRAGLPLPTRQAVRTDSTGRRRYLDLYYEEWSLHIEIDGAHHLDPQQAWLDADRQNCLWIKGDRILRFPSWVVRDLPDQVIQRIREALIAAGYSG